MIAWRVYTKFEAHLKYIAHFKQFETKNNGVEDDKLNYKDFKENVREGIYSN